jgi:hypothetical protein
MNTILYTFITYMIVSLVNFSIIAEYKTFTFFQILFIQFILIEIYKRIQIIKIN